MKKVLSAFMIIIGISIVMIFIGKDMGASNEKVVQVTFENRNVSEESIDIHAQAQCVVGYEIKAMQVDEQPKVENVTELDFTATENRDYTIKVYYQSLTEQKELIETFTTAVDSITSTNNDVSLFVDSRTISENGFTIVTNEANKEAFIEKYNGPETELSIPKFIQGYKVVDIGEYAFQGSLLRRVEIPDSVIRIDDYAFYMVSSLEAIKMPDSVISIGRCAFSNCTSLKSINMPDLIKIPDSVTTIEESAFAYCGSISEVTIPDSVTTIGYGVFQNNFSLSTINIGRTIDNIGIMGLYGVTGSSPSLTTINVSDSARIIPENAFSTLEDITTIHLGNNIESIGHHAFYQCTNLEIINIPDSVSHIDNDAFIMCSSLKKVSLGKIIEYIDIKNIFPDSYQSLETIDFTDLVTLIRNDGLSGFSSLKKVCIGSSVQTIGDRSFYDCQNLETVEFKDPYSYLDSLKRIGESAFENCTSLATIDLPHSVTSIGKSAFSHCTTLPTMYIPSGVTQIDDYTFAMCGSLTSIDLPYSLTSIGNYAFSGCNQLNNSLFLDSVTSIGNNAFSHCKALTYISLNSLNNIGDSAFEMCIKLQDISLPNDSVKRFGSRVFAECQSLDGFYIPDSVTYIDSTSFSQCQSLKTVYIGKTAEIIGSMGNGNSVFAECPALETINIYNATKIDANAFKGLDTVTTIYIGGGTIKDIGDEAFYGCTNLQNINIPDSVTNIGERVFNGCTSLSTLDIGKAVEIIGNKGTSTDLFKECTSLKTINISSTATKIGDFAFYGLNSLQTVNIGNSVKSIGEASFLGCGQLETVDIPKSVESIGRKSFAGCNSLTDITIPDTVNNIAYGAFMNCEKLEKVKILSSTINIGNVAFSNCSSLNTVYMPSTVEVATDIFDDSSTKNIIIMMNNPLELDIPEDSQLLKINNSDQLQWYRMAMAKNIGSHVSEINFYESKDKTVILDDIFEDKGVDEAIYTGASGTELYTGDEITVLENYLKLDTSIDQSIKYELIGKSIQDTKIENNQLIIGENEKSSDLKIQAKSMNTIKELPVTIIPFSSLKITNEPQNVYIEDEKYNPDGLMMTVTWKDGYQEDIKYNEENKDDFTFAYDQLDLTTTIQVIGYKGLTVEQELTIESKYHEKILNDENNDVIVVKGEFTDNSYVTVEKREETDSELYKDLDDKTIVGNYEVKVVGEYQGKLFIVFDVGEENNNKKAYIRHLKQDGTIDQYEETVLVGKVGITVQELSPFVIYIDKEKIDNTPDINDDVLPPIHNDEEPPVNKDDKLPINNNTEAPTIDINYQDQENNVLPVIKGPLVETKNKNQQNTIVTGDRETIIPYITTLGIGILGIGYYLFKRKQRE